MWLNLQGLTLQPLGSVNQPLSLCTVLMPRHLRLLHLLGLLWLLSTAQLPAMLRLYVLLVLLNRLCSRAQVIWQAANRLQLSIRKLSPWEASISVPSVLMKQWLNLQLGSRLA